MPVQADLAFPIGIDAEQGPDQLGAASAHQAIKAKYLTLSQVKANVVNTRSIYMIGFKEYLAYIRLMGRINILDLASDHHFNQFIIGQFIRIPGGNVLAIAEDRDSIADGINFVKFVGYKHDGNAFVFQPPHNIQ